MVYGKGTYEKPGRPTKKKTKKQIAYAKKALATKDPKTLPNLAVAYAKRTLALTLSLIHI
mgnify:CR=1 FL=1